eukprot:4537936-Amphidinium_carterae.1
MSSIQELLVKDKAKPREKSDLEPASTWPGRFKYVEESGYRRCGSGTPNAQPQYDVLHDRRSGIRTSP